ncbi:MFS transporter [Micromonospora sp. WMMD967]|uniref:MFS transporter n=1 Tax=Micromonospora sp. WMMD967 TaxID=3016101 RepID=UPI002415ECCD|nr:MFS transporter [Micromonospora sp. WMMD967]MDG4840781.1 MFS transporter [Micromonospora sp. WMMD967]
MSTTIAPPHLHQKASWAGVVSLSLGVFAFVMAEFLPASLLPRIAADLGVSEGTAGQTVTVTAIGAGLAGLLLPIALPRLDRRHVMLGLTVLAVVANLLVAVAPNLVVLLAARLLLGIGLGGFWALAIAIAAQLVPGDHIGRAVTVINSGVAIATIGAVPLGTWLGELWGWRAVFVLAAGAAVLAVSFQAVTLPRVTPQSTGGLRALGTTLRSGVLVLGLIAILLVAAGQFTGFTYIRPAAEAVSGIDAGGLAVLLLVYGIANMAGTALGGFLADRSLRVASVFFPAILGLGMLAMITTGSTTAGLFVAAALWGFGFGGFPTTNQTWGARTEPERLEQVGGLIITVLQIAIALGAVGGGLLVDGVSASAPLLAGGIAAIAGGVLLANAYRRA